jgi:flagellar motor switch/type III secretory pathway protein FliN
VTAAAWADQIPVLEGAEADRRRRLLGTAEVWADRGQRVARALPRALLGLWPLGSPEAVSVRMTFEGPEGARTLLLDQFPLRIGRGDACGLQLPHAAVSTEHAEIRLERGQAFLMDLRSTNGTRRNGEAATPLQPVPLQPGDRIGIGPFTLTLLGLTLGARAAALETRGSEARPRPIEGLFRAAHPTDRFLRVRMGGGVLFLRVPAAFMRASWQRTTGLPSDALGPMEEGAALYVFDRVARGLSAELGEDIELSGWLLPGDAEREAQGSDLWLVSDLLVKSGDTAFVTNAFLPVPKVSEAAAFTPPNDLAFPASLCLGVVRLRPADLAELEPGDALIPDVFWPRHFLEDAAELGPAWLKVRSFWFGGALLRSEAGVSLRLGEPWLSSPGEDWLMAEDDATSDGPASLPLNELELTVSLELLRFPATLGDLAKWRAGEVLPLAAGPQDPVRLVVETGLQRRVLAEGRVVMVNGKLGVEILRLLTRFEDVAPRS